MNNFLFINKYCENTMDIISPQLVEKIVSYTEMIELEFVKWTKLYPFY